MGSEQSLDWEQQGTLDRHELAHVVLNQYRRPFADPPMVLHEGSAEAKSGIDAATLARWAVEARRESPDVSVADLFLGTNYHCDSGPAYTYGGAFVDFLLRNYSISPFLNFYNRCSPDTFEDDFRAVYQRSLSQLEDQFWQDVKQIVTIGLV